MAQIPPITDAYIDEIVKAPDAYNPTLNKTQGIKLRELIKKLRDYFTQEIQQGFNEQNFTSGLTKTGDTIKLGGKLTGYTEIDRDGKDFLIVNGDQYEKGTFGVTEDVSFIQFTNSSFAVGENYAQMASNAGKIIATGDKITLSTPNNKGAYYDTDYSPLWTVADENVLVSKKYVDELKKNSTTVFEFTITADGTSRYYGAWGYGNILSGYDGYAEGFQPTSAFGINVMQVFVNESATPSFIKHVVYVEPNNSEIRIMFETPPPAGVVFKVRWSATNWQTNN